VARQVPLARLEQTLDASGVAPIIEEALPAAVRPRQLPARTLLLGKMLALADSRNAYLTEAHAALRALPAADQERLGVVTSWKTGPHQLTYRQVEHTYATITRLLSKPEPDGAPSPLLLRLCNQLIEAGIPAAFKNAGSLAVDWTDVEAWSRPVPAEHNGTGTDPEARWGHRNATRALQQGDMFFGYLLSAAVMVNEENGQPVPELARRITVCSSAHDPPAELASVLTQMPGDGIALGDILADSGYAHRVPDTWADPLRSAGAQLVTDLHPHDRGPRGTHQGAIIANGNLYCPVTPRPLLELVPLPPGASAADTAVHDHKTAELARYKLGVHAADDADGYRRHTCPAAAAKIRCPLRPASMTLDRNRPEILAPPAHPQACCTQLTITAGPDVAAKTRQKHDYPSAAWRTSYARRTAAERFNASIKNPAANSIDQGWIRLMGLTPLLLWLSCLVVVRNQRTLNAFQDRQDHARAAAARPRARRRRRELTNARPP
jgi:hypothetical protein